MLKICQSFMQKGRIAPLKIFVRGRTEKIENFFSTSQYQINSTVSETGRNQTRYLPVFNILISVQKFQRVRVNKFTPIVACVYILEQSTVLRTDLCLLRRQGIPSLPEYLQKLFQLRYHCRDLQGLDHRHIRTLRIHTFSWLSPSSVFPV